MLNGGIYDSREITENGQEDIYQQINSAAALLSHSHIWAVYFKEYTYQSGF